jgi:rhomboid protease GluP
MAKGYQASTKTDLTPSQFLMLTSLSMDDLKWQHRFTGDNTIEAKKWLGNNTQKITVSVNGDEVIVDSRYDSWTLMDLGKNKKTTTELLDTIQAKQSLYTGEELDVKLEELKAASAAALKDLEERLERGALTASEKIALGTGGHKITYGLIILNVAFFVIMAGSGVGLFDPEAQDLVKWGANVKSYTEGGEWWRLVTSMFMHIGIIHLLLNMYALYQVGIHLEPVLGRWKFLGAYLATGIFAGLTSIWWHEDIASAGASGAIFGMYGVFLALLTTKFFDPTAQKSLLSSIGVFVLYNLVYGMKSGIDNSAHIGGLVSGLVLGYLFFLLQRTEWKKYYAGICIAVAFAAAFLFLNGKQNDDSAFYKIWDEVSVLETKAMESLQNKEKLTSEEFISQARSVSLPAWNDAKQKLQPTIQYKLTPKVGDLRELLSRYLDLRIQFTNEMIQAEASGDWTAANGTANKIQAVLDQLTGKQKQ